MQGFAELDAEMRTHEPSSGPSVQAPLTDICYVPVGIVMNWTLRSLKTIGTVFSRIKAAIGEG